MTFNWIKKWLNQHSSFSLFLLKSLHTQKLTASRTPKQHYIIQLSCTSKKRNKNQFQNFRCRLRSVKLTINDRGDAFWRMWSPSFVTPVMQFFIFNFSFFHWINESSQKAGDSVIETIHNFIQSASCIVLICLWHLRMAYVTNLSSDRSAIATSPK